MLLLLLMVVLVNVEDASGAFIATLADNVAVKAEYIVTIARIISHFKLFQAKIARPLLDATQTTI